MRQLVSDIDALSDADDRMVFQGVTDVVMRFNKRWAIAGTWQFEILVCDSPRATGLEVLRQVEARDEEMDMEPEAWLKLCDSALEDTGAQEQFLEELAAMSME